MGICVALVYFPLSTFPYAERLTKELARDDRSDLIFFDRTSGRHSLPRLPREELPSHSYRNAFQSLRLLSESDRLSSSESHTIAGNDSTTLSSKDISQKSQASWFVFDSKFDCRFPFDIIRLVEASRAAVAGDDS